MLATKAKEFIPPGQPLHLVTVIEVQLKGCINFSHQAKAFNKTDVFAMQLDELIVELFISESTHLATQFRVHFTTYRRVYVCLGGLINDLQNGGNGEQHASHAGQDGARIKNRACGTAKANQRDKCQCQVGISCEISVAAEKANGRSNFPFHIVARTWNALFCIHIASSGFLLLPRTFGWRALGGGYLRFATVRIIWRGVCRLWQITTISCHGHSLVCVVGLVFATQSLLHDHYECPPLNGCVAGEVFHAA